VTARGANPPAKIQAYADNNGLPPKVWRDWADSLSCVDAQVASDALLESLEDRGLFWRWQGM
jgi:hypothetical protein